MKIEPNIIAFTIVHWSSATQRPQLTLYTVYISKKILIIQLEIKRNPYAIYECSYIIQKSTAFK